MAGVIVILVVEEAPLRRCVAQVTLREINLLAIAYAELAAEGPVGNRRSRRVAHRLHALHLQASGVLQRHRLRAVALQSADGQRPEVCTVCRCRPLVGILRVVGHGDVEGGSDADEDALSIITKN